MSTYLVVAHQTAGSPELSEALLERRLSDPDADFVLLVPTTSSHTVSGNELQTHEVAGAIVEDAREQLTRAGVPLSRVEAGNEDPLTAIANELKQREHTYAGIIISTFPPGISRWLHPDLISEANKRFGVPVQHVTAQPVTESPVTVEQIRDETDQKLADYRGNPIT